MSKSSTRKNFMLSLCKKGIPARYAWRVSRELNDHEEDLSENGSEATLGDQDELLDQIVDSYKSRTFAGRHPLFVFLLFPFPIVFTIYVLTITLTFLGLALIYEIAHYFGYQLIESELLISLVLYSSLILFPTIISTLLIFRWARRAGIKLKYAIASCLPVFLMAILVVMKVLPEDTHNTARIAFGLNLPLARWLGPGFGPIDQPWPLPGMNQIMQVVISALIIFYLVHHEKVKQNRLAEKLIDSD